MNAKKTDEKRHYYSTVVLMKRTTDQEEDGLTKTTTIVTSKRRDATNHRPQEGTKKKKKTVASTWRWVVSYKRFSTGFPRSVSSFNFAVYTDLVLSKPSSEYSLVFVRRTKNKQKKNRRSKVSRLKR